MKNHLNRRRATSGFSLMELLVVVSIIVILAGLTVGAMAYVSQKQAQKQAELQIALLQVGLQEYYADNGEFPNNNKPTGEKGTTSIQKELFPTQSDEKIYLTELDPDNDTQGWLSGSGINVTILDPWGSEYRYRTNRAGSSRVYAANPDFDLWSCGPDGVTNAGSGGKYDPKDPKNLDDVRGW